uniref:Uncharacterized protein n=1 Tax=Podoviridae sp. ctjUd6 TaxID=2825270 RepID=A0A8S5U2Q7_9CAUD|nr:MAG TPA: hypothetical protein [Podoviridae sp. ctjUd6]
MGKQCRKIMGGGSCGIGCGCLFHDSGIVVGRGDFQKILSSTFSLTGPRGALFRK